ncbi:MAG: LuxR C-terminal-related transcriptional regulator [Alcaligenaceae bacterium]|nr:LuxR C-terminal-related transcriptional regulator [Alcaligenaceae bacterium]
MKSKLRKYEQQQVKLSRKEKMSDTAEHFTMKRMTVREKEIFLLIKKGLTSKECAAALNISVRTVELHRANIIHKYQVKNIVELVYRIKKHHRDDESIN